MISNDRQNLMMQCMISYALAVEIKMNESQVDFDRWMHTVKGIAALSDLTSPRNGKLPRHIESYITAARREAILRSTHSTVINKVMDQWEHIELDIDAFDRAKTVLNKY